MLFWLKSKFYNWQAHNFLFLHRLPRSFSQFCSSPHPNKTIHLPNNLCGNFIIYFTLNISQPGRPAVHNQMCFPWPVASFCRAITPQRTLSPLWGYHIQRSSFQRVLWTTEKRSVLLCALTCLPSMVEPPLHNSLKTDDWILWCFVLYKVILSLSILMGWIK
jgi:hypothetical protein